MNWIALLSVFLLSTIKFMFSPLAGEEMHLSFFETYFSAVSGGIVGACIFYFSSNYFMQRAIAKHKKKEEDALKNGTILKRKKKFTRTNKFIVRLKRSLGQWGICIIAPLLLSVPIGSIISAKFYGKSKSSFLIIVFGMFLNGIITTSITYWLLD
jgi:hypothetical protein